MQYYIVLSGVIEGPHSLETVQSMLQSGRLVPSDLGAVPGDPDWKPLSELIDCSAATAKPGASPPPLPPQPPELSLDVPFQIDGAIPSGAHGKTVRQIVEETAAGGRFVIYQYVVSVIILSFRRSSPITYIPPGKSGLDSALGWTLLTMMLGWWGFPWGIIFTIAALARNASGGIDVTEPILGSWVGPQRADALVRNRPKRPGGGMWILRGVIAAPLVLVALMFYSLIQGASESNEEEKRLPGYAEFNKADQFIHRSGVKKEGGNTSDSIAAAAMCRSMLQGWRDAAITDDSSDKSKKQNTEISVWCETRGSRCLFLIKVPDLRHFTDEAKDKICEAAWFTSQISAKPLGLATDSELAVAVRGGVIYDRMLTGRYVSNLDPDSENWEPTVKAAIRKTDRMLTKKDRMLAYFAPAER